ncbi:IS1182 family transposase [Pedosphaera parvula]|nr:IS1182 family transposase [Pedosphaera parvula]
MMAHAIAPDYGQQFIFPPALEDWVPKDHPARFLREFVDQLDLSLLGFVMPSATEGRPPYAPSLLLKIWLYGYFHRIRSTRKLEAACREHLSLLWLTGLIQPDHNSLWRFWRDNQRALREIFKQTVQVAVRAGCVGLALQALDGTKIEACAAGPSSWSREYMEKLLSALDEALAHTELAIVQEERAQPGYRLPAGLAERQALREQIKGGLAQLAADGRAYYHPVEPEARRMKVDGKNRFAYNAQALADEKTGVIVACEATRQETDVEQLVPMIEQGRENVGIAALNTLTVADTGYGAGADLRAASEKGLNVLAPPMEGSSTADQPYATRYFHYDAKERTVTCPQGKKLDHEGHTTNKGQRVERYRCHWRDCPVRAQCTRDPKGRQLEVRPHTPQVQAMRERLQEPPARALWSQRGQIIERIFAQIKQHEGFRRWTVWGLAAVKTQWAMLCATLNLRVLYQTWRTKRGTRPVGAQMAARLMRQRKKWGFALTTATRHMAGRRSPLASSTFFARSNSNQACAS